jgi:hypothetical protein
MDWVQDMTARWMRILGAAGGGRTPLDEAVHQISMIGEAQAKKSGFGRLKRNAVALAEASTVTVLCRQLIAGVIISDLMIDRLCALSGQARDQVLDQLSGDLPRRLPNQQLRALQIELSDSCTLLRSPDPAFYSDLGNRIGQLLRLAEEQASAIIDAAHAEAADITTSAGTHEPLCKERGTLTKPEAAADDIPPE